MRRVALVTGGAKRIGAAICRELAAAGYAVVIHFNRSGDEAESLRTSLAAMGVGAASVPGDLAEKSHLAAFYSRACQPFGPPTLLVNNASLFLADTLETIEPERLSANLATNLEAPVLLARVFAETLPAGETGAIINLIDQRVLRPNPQFFSYAIAKAGLHAATRMMAQALAPRIRVNAVGPGPTLPNSHDGAEGFEREARGTLLQHAVSPEEIARTVRFLAEAESVTGQMLAVDSGQHLGWRTPDIVE